MESNSSQQNMQRPQIGNTPRFCSHCGAKLDDGARFCKNCGEVVGQATDSSKSNTTARSEQESAPYNHDGESSNCSQREDANEPNTERRTFFAGEILKCPNCGEVLESFAVNCPSCGCELRNTFISKSIHDFSQKLERATTDEQRVLLIRNFPIANNKEDIFEFMILASTNIKGEQPKSVFDAWTVKFEQSYQKAKLTFGNDPDFEDIEAIYKQTFSQIDKQRITHGAKSVGNIFSKIFFIMPNPVFGFVALFLFIFEIIRLFSGDFAGLDVIFCALVLGIVFKLTEKKSKQKKLNEAQSTAESAEVITEEPVKIKIPSAVANGTSENYAVVESMLVQAGFINVRAVALHDLTMGVFKKPGVVESITIDGKELSSYFRRKFPPNVPIIISYHSLR